MGMGSNFNYKLSLKDQEKRAEERRERKRLKRAKKKAEKERIQTDSSVTKG